MQTQILGGEWAIFGDGFVAGEAAISIEIDLTGIAFVSLEQSFVEGNEDGLRCLITFRGSFGSPGFSFLFPLEALDPAKPGVRTTQDIRVEEVIGSFPVSISWGLDPEISSTGKRQQPLVAFIDNITFHPVPEPSSLALLAFGLAALMVARRRTE